MKLVSKLLTITLAATCFNLAAKPPEDSDPDRQSSDQTRTLKQESTMGTEDIFEAAKRRKDELEKQFESLEPTTIYGVVDPSGPGLSRSQGETNWTLSFKLNAWNQSNGARSEEPAIVQQTLSDEEAYSLRKRINAYSVVKIYGKVALENSFSSPQIQMLELLDPDFENEKLKTISIELQKPVSFEDPELGTLNLNKALNFFATMVQWRRAQVELVLPMDTCTDIEALVHSAKKVLNNQLQWDDRIRDFAATKLLPLKNDGWLDEDERPIKKHQFTAQIRLTTIEIQQNGDIEFWFDDGNLFWGHSIIVRGNTETGLSHASIEG